LKLLVTGSDGFLGRNLIARINAENIGDVLSYDLFCDKKTLADYVKNADVIIHLAGVNRPKAESEFYTGNLELTEELIKLVNLHNSKAPIIFSSTTQIGNGSEYANSKEMAEKALIDYQKSTGNDVFIYRFPGLFGKWSQPNYNTVVATFCYNIARDIPIEIRDPNYELTLCYVDDVVDLILKTIKERKLQSIEPLYKITLGQLAAKISDFASKEDILNIADMSDLLTKKLYATYISFLPEDKLSYHLTMHEDERGSFTEVLHLPKHGQVSVSTTKPGITRGDHWHDTKSEKFLVVNGKGIVRLRRINTSDIIEYPVSADKMEVVDIPPGYTHNFTNTGDVDMVTVIWVNELLNKDKPDTFFEKV
jgi:UDP-2-acetamido-2,6-beta-L-arabino-hexul-4-ose reductase